MGADWAPLKIAIFIGVSFFLIYITPLPELINFERAANAMEEVNKPYDMTVVLKRKYIDGEVSTETVTEKIWSMADFWNKYDNWQLLNMETGKITFGKQIDDISPLLKTNGYFGITEKGVLTIFNGKPEETNIIQSFFQIDIGRLESTKCEELKKGIPIQSKEQYEKVINTFKTYSKITKEAN